MLWFSNHYRQQYNTRYTYIPIYMSEVNENYTYKIANLR